MRKEVSFTDKKIKELKPSISRYSVYDTKHHSLEVLVHPKGTKTFCFYGRIDNVPTHKKIGNYPEVSVETARQEVIRIQNEINQKKNPLRNSKWEKMLFSNCYSLYMEERSNLAEKTKDDYKILWKTSLSSTLANKMLYQIDGEILQELHRKLSTHPYQANRAIVLVKAIFNHIIKKHSYNGPNPAKAVELNPEKCRTEILLPNQISKVVEQMTAAEKEREKYIIQSAILALMVIPARKNNILAEKWEDIDLENKIWFIPKTKNGDSHTYTIPDILIPVLNQLKEMKLSDNPYVFPSTKSSTGHIVEVRKESNKLQKQAGITNPINIHGWRHTYGTISAMMGHSRDVIKTALGHKTDRASTNYINLGNQYLSLYRDETINKMFGEIKSNNLYTGPNNLKDTEQSVFEQIQSYKTSKGNKTSLIVDAVPMEEVKKLYNQIQAEKASKNKK